VIRDEEQCFSLISFSFKKKKFHLHHVAHHFSDSLCFPISQGILPLSGLSLEAVSVDPKAPHSPHMFEISGESVGTENTVYSTEHDFMSSPLSSRANGGLQGLHMRQRCRATEMDATHRRQEVQVNGSTHESLPLRPLLSCN